MTVVNMHQAKSQLSKLVESIEGGSETEIVIARNGKPAARLVPIVRAGRRPIGMFNGQYPNLSSEELDADDAEIEAQFFGNGVDDLVGPE